MSEGERFELRIGEMRGLGPGLSSSRRASTTDEDTRKLAQTIQDAIDRLDEVKFEREATFMSTLRGHNG